VHLGAPFDGRREKPSLGKPLCQVSVDGVRLPELERTVDQRRDLPIGFTAKYSGNRFSPFLVSSSRGWYFAPASARPNATRAELPDIGHVPARVDITEDGFSCSTRSTGSRKMKLRGWPAGSSGTKAAP